MPSPAPGLTRLIELDRAAVLATVGLACRIGADLSLLTPCGDWTLADLLAHLTGQQLGFAAAARGDGAPLQRWEPVRCDDPVVGYLASCAEVLTAFAEPGVAEQDFALPELRPGRGFPAAQAISFHLIDNVVHAWDLAVSLGAELDLPGELVEAGLRVARLVPNGSERTQPGAAFSPALPVADGASPLDTTLLLLGRQPGWTPPAGV